MLDDEVQFLILNLLYNEWMNDIRSLVCLKELGQSKFEIEEKRWLANARYLADKYLIQRPSTISFYTRLNIHGVRLIESTKLSVDIKKRINVLKYLKEKYNKNPEISFNKNTLSQELGYSDVELERVIWYLDESGLVKNSWSGAKNFWVKISDRGLDLLNQPSILEQESMVMASAYSLLYQLENELRVFYETTLREHYGDEWWVKGVSADIREKAEKKKKTALLREKGDHSIIFYTDFEDLRILPNKKWKQIFGPILKTQHGVLSRLGDLEPIRHKIAHSRLLTDDELHILTVFKKQISELLE